jgi:hypothetical protein
MRAYEPVSTVHVNFVPHLRNSHHFDEDLTTQIGHDTRVIETWLAHTEPLVQQGLAETAQGIATGHYDIRDFFMPLAAPPPPSD